MLGTPFPVPGADFHRPLLACDPYYHIARIACPGFVPTWSAKQAESLLHRKVELHLGVLCRFDETGFRPRVRLREKSRGVRVPYAAAHPQALYHVSYTRIAPVRYIGLLLICLPFLERNALTERWNATAMGRRSVATPGAVGRGQVNPSSRVALAAWSRLKTSSRLLLGCVGSSMSRRNAAAICHPACHCRQDEPV